MEITANAVQVIKPNANVMFDTIRTCGNASIMYQPGSGLVTLRGLCCGQPRARFRIVFTTNLKADSSMTIGGVTMLSLAVAVNGEAIPITTMTTTVGDTTSTYNVSTEVLVDVPACCCQTVSIKNITDDITVDTLNANLIVERVA